MRLIPLLMQLEMGTSISRYLPATGTAGLARSWVRGNSRAPWPPPRMRLRMERVCMGDGPRMGTGTQDATPRLGPGKCPAGPEGELPVDTTGYPCGQHDGLLGAIVH